MTLSGLSYGAINYPFTKVFTGQWSATYGDAMQTIYKRANYNASKWNSLPFAESYKYDDVEQIMTAYATLLAAGKIPALKRGISEADNNKIVSEVAKQAGRREDLTRVVLYEAYWAAYGTPVAIPESMLLDPEKLQGEDTSGIDDLMKSLKWIAIIGLGAFALSSLVQLRNSIQK